MKHIAIRSATASDLANLAKIDRDGFGDESYPLFVLKQFMDIAPSGLIVAEENAALTGYALAASVGGQATTSWLLSLVVAQSYRGLGVGRALAKNIIERQQMQGATKILLTVNPENTVAITLYRSLGFADLDLIADYFGRGSDRLTMVMVSNC